MFGQHDTYSSSHHNYKSDLARIVRSEISEKFSRVSEPILEPNKLPYMYTNTANFIFEMFYFIFHFIYDAFGFVVRLKVTVNVKETGRKGSVDFLSRLFEY